MSSKLSILSFIVFALATYCYALPIEDQSSSSTFSTPINELVTGKTIVEHEVKINMRLLTDDESTDVPQIHSEQLYGEHQHLKNNIPQIHDDVSRPTRLSEEILFTSSPYTFISESPLSSLSHNERLLNDFLFTTMESSTQFEQRSANINDYKPEEVTHSERDVTDQEDKLEMTTVDEPLSSTPFGKVELQTSEPSTSVHTFGKYTGLLRNEETTSMNKPSSWEMKSEQSHLSTSTESDNDEHSFQKSKSQIPSKQQNLVKTISVIPGKITETRIYTNEASKAYLMRQPNQQEKQLTQGQKQPIIETSESNN